MKDLVSFDDYELISDLLVPLGKNASLRMCVRVGNANKNNEKVPMEAEYMYRTNKYVNKDKVITVKRKFFPYMAIEYKDKELSNSEKETIKITHYDILGFRKKINEVDELVDKVFIYDSKKGSVRMVRENKFRIVSMPSGNKLEFTPFITKHPNGSADLGVLMVINDKSLVEIYLKTWKAFVYYVQTTDLYGWAAAVVSGFTNARIGNNVQDLSTISRDPTVYDEFNEEVGFKNTKPLSKEEKRKSFFDD